MLRFLATLFFLSLTILTIAQPGGGKAEWNGQSPETTISGSVVDGQSGQAIEYATLALFRKRDSSLVTGAVTDVDGTFEITTRPGRFFMKVEFISYTPVIVDNIQLGRGVMHHDAGKISIQPDTKQLEAVEVVEERSTFQTHLDKKIFNVGRDISSLGGSASDVLDNIPSVTVDIDGNVALRGSENVRILIDGKPSGLTGISSSEALQQLGADMIEKVEIITNPSARYDAEGMSGIINIILKKNRKNGWNGSVTVGTGWPHNHNGSVNMNYKTKKINLFGAYSAHYRTRPGEGYTATTTFFGDTTSLLEQTESFERKGWKNNFRLGGDWYLNKKTTLTLSGKYGFGQRDNTADVRYEDFGSQEEIQSLDLRETTETEDDESYDATMYFRRDFNKEGRKLTAEFQYSYGYEEELMDARNLTVLLPDEELLEETGLQTIANNEELQNFLGQADYVHKFKENGNFEIGWKSNVRQINTDYSVDDFVDSTNSWVVNDGVSNRFRYDEQIHAVYAIIGNQWRSMSYQFGLRTEFSDVSTHLLETDELNDRKYIDPFPSAHLSFDLGKENSFQVSYSRRIRRPRFWYLNPFFTYVNPRNFRSGNPNLDPQYTHSTEIAHIKRWEKLSVTSSIYYRHTTGVMARISHVDSSGVTTSRPENLQTAENFGAELVLSYEPFKWWRMFGSANFFRQILDGGNLGEDFTSDSYSWTGRLNSRWKFWKGTELQIVANYRGPAQTTQGKRKAMTFADIALSKDVLKNRGTLSLKLSDVFGTRKRRSESEGETFFIESERQWHPRRFIASFTYRINQQKKRERSRGDWGGGDDMEF